MQSVGAAVINFQTPDLLADAVMSFRSFYPDIPLDIVDNGSKDKSRAVLQRLKTAFPRTTRLTFHDRNLYHGPAMDQALRDAEADVVYIFDSDTVTKKGGFLELMQDDLRSARVWAVGQTAMVDSRGFVSEEGTRVPLSAYMMIDRKKYLQLPPFRHHGLPVLGASRAAASKGWSVERFPIDAYVDHLGRGTARRFGYGLGWRSRLEYLLHRFGL